MRRVPQDPDRDDEDERRRGLHRGRRFAGVAPTPEADGELTWFFGEAETDVGAPSVQGALLRHPGRGAPHAVETRAEALHAARKIWARLCAIGPRELGVLEALYTPRRWPRALVRALGPLAGVVHALPALRVAHLAARRDRCTDAATPAAWLAELAVGRPSALRVYRQHAGAASGEALGAYEAVPRREAIVVPWQEEP